MHRDAELIDYDYTETFFCIFLNFCTSWIYVDIDIAIAVCRMWVWIYSVGDMQVVPQYEFYANVALEIKIFVFKEIYFLCTIKTSHFIELEMNICEYRISAVRSRGKKASKTSQHSTHPYQDEPELQLGAIRIRFNLIFKNNVTLFVQSS